MIIGGKLILEFLNFNYKKREFFNEQFLDCFLSNFFWTISRDRYRSIAEPIHEYLDSMTQTFRLEGSK